MPTPDALSRLKTRSKATKRYASTLRPGDILHAPIAAFRVVKVERAHPSPWLSRGGNSGGGVVVQVLTEYSNGDPLEHNLVLRDMQEVLVYRA
ncbi:MAG: hypothetical protein NVS3B1_06360 [Marmoricola sp.]